jgi:hypothetical protein
MSDIDYVLGLSFDGEMSVTLIIDGVKQEKLPASEFIAQIRNSDKIRDERYVKMISAIKKDLKKIPKVAPKSKYVPPKTHYECSYYYGNSERDKGVIKRKIVVASNGERFEGDELYSRICKQSDMKYGKFKIDTKTLNDIIARKIIDVVYYVEEWDSEYWFYPEDILSTGNIRGQSTWFDCDIGWLRERFL